MRIIFKKLTIILTSGTLAKAGEESDLITVCLLLLLVVVLKFLLQLLAARLLVLTESRHFVLTESRFLVHFTKLTVQLCSRPADTARYPAPDRRGCGECGGILL